MLQLYSIMDKKTGAYMPPFHVAHVAEATRSIEIEFEKPDSKLRRFAADYALYLVGNFDPTSGFLYPTAEAGPQFTIEVASLLPKSPVPLGKEVK